MYEVAVEPSELAKAYLQRFYATVEHAMRIGPKARVLLRGNKVVFKFTGIGQRWMHHVYVEFTPNPGKKAGIFVVKPAYPMYLFAVLAPFSLLSYPAAIIRVGEEVRCVMVEDIDSAVVSLADAMTKLKLIEPGDFGEESGASFEGILYDTPAGHVAFLSDKMPFKRIDVIEGHVEDDLGDDNVMYPYEFLSKWLSNTGMRVR